MRREVAVAYRRIMPLHPAGRERWSSPHPDGTTWRDRRGGYRGRRRAFVPMFVALVQVFGSLAASAWHPEARPLDALGVSLLLVAPVALMWRRARLLGAAATLAATIAYVTLDYPIGPILLGAVATVLAALMHASSKYAVWAVVGGAFIAYVHYAKPLPAHAIAIGVLAVAVLTAGEGIRLRNSQLREMARARAEQNRAREEQEKRQVSDERLRIARELHDVIGHHLSLINVQAGVGLHLMDEQPAQARAALTAIRQASSEALREVRGVLSALRPEDEGVPRAPAPSLSSLPLLLDEVRGGGLPVTLETRGEEASLPAEVDRAAYRIVQEALTNVRRHAGSGATAQVLVAFDEASLALTVADDGVGPEAEAGEGNGIVGMRERAVALGGSLEAGRGPTGGYQVIATLPIVWRANGSGATA